jgi:alpha-L-fucosidase
VSTGGSGKAGATSTGGDSSTRGGTTGTTSAGGTTGGTSASGTGGKSTGGGTTTGGTSSGGTSGTAGSTGEIIGQVCPARTGGPAGLAPLPSSAQVSYQRTEMTSFIHYGLATYDGLEQCSPSDDPSIFNPSKLDSTSVGQWISTLKSAGARQTMLVTKHSCGFTLWPSQYTSYSVKSSPWQSGKGDVLKLFTDAMKANDMRVAWYLSPWDSKYTSDKTDYETYFKNQLTELFSYAAPYELEFDGFHAPTGNVNWKNVFAFIKQAQPNTLIWAGPEIVKTGATPDLQWIGNENGTGSRTTSSVDTSNCGGGKNWCAWECNTSTHRPNWFWHPNPGIMALADLQKVYFQTVGMNCTLNINVPPSQTGEFDAKDVSLLSQFATWYNGLYKTNLLKGAPATADSTWATAGFEAGQAADDDVCSYWAAASGTLKASLTVTPASPITVNLISIREAIELGERVKKYHVELMQNGSWVTAPTDKSGTKIQGTVIGNRQLWQLNGAKVEALKLVIDDAKDSPTIAEFAAY